MDRKGLSDVVVAILMILLVIAAVSIIWAFVSVFINDGANQIDSSVFTTSLSVAKVDYLNETSKSVAFLIKREMGNGNMTGFRVVLSDINGESDSFIYNESLDELNTKYITLNYSSSGLSNISKIEVVPILITNKNTVLDGKVFGSYKIKNEIEQKNIEQNNEVDLIAPSLAIIYPTSITYSVQINSLNFSVSSDAVSCWYSVNNGLVNVSTSCGLNISGISSVLGNNLWKIWANDSSGNIVEREVSFVVNNPLPPSFIVVLNTNLGSNLSTQGGFGTGAVFPSLTFTSPYYPDYSNYGSTSFLDNDLIWSYGLTGDEGSCIKDQSIAGVREDLNITLGASNVALIKINTASLFYISFYDEEVDSLSLYIADHSSNSWKLLNSTNNLYRGLGVRTPNFLSSTISDGLSDYILNDKISVMLFMNGTNGCEAGFSPSSPGIDVDLIELNVSTK
jgi:hypothetical protein